MMLHIEKLMKSLGFLFLNLDTSQVIEMNLEKALGAVNISAIVIDKIEGLNAKELEDMVFGVMKRELRAIVYLGAALGFFMGFINILF